MTYPALTYVYMASIPIPASVGIWKFKSLSKSMKILAFLSVLACFDAVAEVVVAYLIHYNTFLSDYYEFVEFCMFWGIYHFAIKKKFTRWLVSALASVLTIIWLTKVPTFYNPQIPIGDFHLISRVFLLAISLITFTSLMEDVRVRLVEISIFWVVFGVILYSAGTLTVFGLGNQFLKLGRSYFNMAWNVNLVLGIAANIFFTKAFLCKQQA